MPDYYSISHQEMLTGFFNVYEGTIYHPKLGKKIKRLATVGRDAVAAIVFNKDTGNLIFVKQFRYPTSIAGQNEIIECVAGGVSKHSVMETLMGEIREEIGYSGTNKIQLINRFFSSPGLLAERVNLYYVEVDNSHKITNAVLGLENEGESIELIEYHYTIFEDGIPNTIQDAKTIIGIQWFINNILPRLNDDANNDE